MSHWEFDLNEEGMLPLHRAGLTGLLASLYVLEQSNELPEGISYKVDGNRLILDGLEPKLEAIHSFMTTLYRIDDDGLIDFPLFRSLKPYQKATIQGVFMGTFIQHPKVRSAAKKQRLVQDVVDGDSFEYSYLPLFDFRHRELKIMQDFVKSINKNKPIEVSGWSFLGGAVKHQSIKETYLRQSHDKFFLLLCAPLGCLYFKGLAYQMNGDWDKKVQSIVVIPKPTNLVVHAKALQKYYRESSLLDNRLFLASGESDAALQIATVFELENQMIGRRLKTNYHVMRYGKTAWNPNQSTRTGVIAPIRIMKETALAYKEVNNVFQPRPRKTKEGKLFYSGFPMKETIASNLLLGKPWYLGFSKYMQSEIGVQIRFWKGELIKMLEESKMWQDQERREFIDLMHNCIAHHYGMLSSKINNSNADRQSMFAREYERLVLRFSKCRTKQALRSEIMNFVAKTRGKIKDADKEDQKELNILLQVAFSKDWYETQDLCLLAIATYKGKGSETIDNGLVADETADQQAVNE